MKKLSKYLFVLCLISSVIIASSPFASAVTVGGADIEIVGGSYWIPGSGDAGAYDNVKIANAPSDTDYWDASMSLINPVSSYTNWQSTGLFTFSGLNNYGTLSVVIQCSGSIESSASTGLYESNVYGNPSVKLDTSVSFDYSKNRITCVYTGYVPSRFNIVFYFYSASNQGTLRSDYYYFTFTPIDKGTQDIIANDNANTDKILGAGSDVAQPNFGSTNGQIDDTVGQIESIEGEYQIDKDVTQASLDKGNSFLQGTDMQRASVQVKTWIERFVSDSPTMNGFFIAAMVLGLCFWVIGRKAGT